MKIVDIDSILAEIREQVQRRRAEGAYPPGLESELESEFVHILSLTQRGVNQRSDEVQELLSLLKQQIHDLSGLSPITSRVPGGRLFHRIVRRIISRQTMGVAAQTRAVSQTLSRISELLVDGLVRQEDADKRMVTALSKHVLDRVAVIDHLVLLVSELESKVRTLEGKD